MYTIIAPISLNQTKKKLFYLNLNVYRNAHYIVLNNMKVKFKELLKPQISKLPKMAGVKLTFTLFLGSNRSADMNNIICIVEKFFCDALVELGKLPDDSIEFITSTDNRFGGVDKTNPRVEITLEPTEITEEENMQITISQKEIETAITDYVKSQVTINEDQTVSIDLKATRGADGWSAVIDIQNANAGKATKASAGASAPKARTPVARTQAKSEASAATETAAASPTPSTPASGEAAAESQEAEGTSAEGQAEDPSESAVAATGEVDTAGQVEANRAEVDQPVDDSEIPAFVKKSIFGQAQNS